MSSSPVNPSYLSHTDKVSLLIAKVTALDNRVTAEMARLGRAGPEARTPLNFLNEVENLTNELRDLLPKGERKLTAREQLLQGESIRLTEHVIELQGRFKQSPSVSSESLYSSSPTSLPPSIPGSLNSLGSPIEPSPASPSGKYLLGSSTGPSPASPSGKDPLVSFTESSPASPSGKDFLGSSTGPSPASPSGKDPLGSFTESSPASPSRKDPVYQEHCQAQLKEAQEGLKKAQELAAEYREKLSTAPHIPFPSLEDKNERVRMKAASNDANYAVDRWKKTVRHWKNALK